MVTVVGELGWENKGWDTSDKSVNSVIKGDFWVEGMASGDGDGDGDCSLLGSLG